MKVATKGISLAFLQNNFGQERPEARWRSASSATAGSSPRSTACSPDLGRAPRRLEEALCRSGVRGQSASGLRGGAPAHHRSWANAAQALIRAIGARCIRRCRCAPPGNLGGRSTLQHSQQGRRASIKGLLWGAAPSIRPRLSAPMISSSPAPGRSFPMPPTPHPACEFRARRAAGSASGRLGRDHRVAERGVAAEHVTPRRSAMASRRCEAARVDHGRQQQRVEDRLVEGDAASTPSIPESACRTRRCALPARCLPQRRGRPAARRRWPARRPASRVEAMNRDAHRRDVALRVDELLETSSRRNLPATMRVAPIWIISSPPAGSSPVVSVSKTV